MATEKFELSFAFTDVRFLDNVVRLTCKLSDSEKKLSYTLQMFIAPMNNGEWRFEGFKWLIKNSNIDEINLAQTLINKAAQLMKTINMWSGEQTKSSGKAVINQKRVPDDSLSTNSISFRNELLRIPSPRWNELWGRIEERIENDIFFRVHGFRVDEINLAIRSLKKVFPWEWVRARYNASKTTNNPPGMGDDFPPEEGESWFPAYHLARTALGAICVDPGWNYLVEIGLSINELSNFPEVETLIRKLSRSPGTQHHICFAAELYKKGYLIGLEPSTGSGSATNDLLVSINKNNFAIEVKEFSTKTPRQRLIKELNEKVKKLPKNPITPVIFHVVMREEDAKDRIREEAFFNELETIKDKIPEKISAVVAGTRFVDSLGGRVKRETRTILINSSAKNKTDTEDIRKLFENNFSEITYPCYGLGNFFYFEN